MLSFTEFIAQHDLQEGKIRKTALVKYATDAKTHGTKSAKAYQDAMQTLNPPEGSTRLSSSERMQSALSGIAQGNLHQRHQIGALVAMVVLQSLKRKRSRRQ